MPFAAGLGGEERLDLADQRREMQRPALEDHLAGVELGEVEHVVDQVHQHVGALPLHVGQAGAPRLGEASAGAASRSRRSFPAAACGSRGSPGSRSGPWRRSPPAPPRGRARAPGAARRSNASRAPRTRRRTPPTGSSTSPAASAGIGGQQRDRADRAGPQAIEQRRVRHEQHEQRGAERHPAGDAAATIAGTPSHQSAGEWMPSWNSVMTATIANSSTPMMSIARQ